MSCCNKHLQEDISLPSLVKMVPRSPDSVLRHVKERLCDTTCLCDLVAGHHVTLT